MNKQELAAQIRQKESYLCIGLDTDPAKIPSFLLKEKDPVFEFNRRIIDATADLCVAYKPNIAFYESLGPAGWESLARTLEYIPEEHFTIADAKRGDIGNTADRYAVTFFEQYAFDAITVAPYMGSDSVKPFLSYDNKWTILLALTSNEGSNDYQQQLLENGKRLYQQVIDSSKAWGSSDRLMYVVGATKAKAFEEIRQQVPDHFLLVPGVGAQGGDLETVSRLGMNKDCGLLVNSSRGILYAGNDTHFAEAARDKALTIKNDMAEYLRKYL